MDYPQPLDIKLLKKLLFNIFLETLMLPHLKANTNYYYKIIIER